MCTGSRQVFIRAPDFGDYGTQDVPGKAGALVTVVGWERR